MFYIDRLIPIINILVLQFRKLLREVKSFVQGHTAGNCSRSGEPGFKPGLCDFQAVMLYDAPSQIRPGSEWVAS